MTKEEIGELVAALPQGLDADEFIHRLVNWAVDREREACAKLCDDLAANGELSNHYAVAARAVRARGAAMNLRKAAEMALECLEFHWDREETDWEAHPDHVVEAKRALRQALAQPEREWVNLTEKEIVEATHFVRGVYDSARAIEAKLKQKNEPA